MGTSQECEEKEDVVHRAQLLLLRDRVRVRTRVRVRGVRGC